MPQGPAPQRAPGACAASSITASPWRSAISRTASRSHGVTRRSAGPSTAFVRRPDRGLEIVGVDVRSSAPAMSQKTGVAPMCATRSRSDEVHEGSTTSSPGPHPMPGTQGGGPRSRSPPRSHRRATNLRSASRTRRHVAPCSTSPTRSTRQRLHEARRRPGRPRAALAARSRRRPSDEGHVRRGHSDSHHCSLHSDAYRLHGGKTGGRGMNRGREGRYPRRRRGSAATDRTRRCSRSRSCPWATARSSRSSSTASSTPASRTSRSASATSPISSRPCSTAGRAEPV